MVAVAIRRRVVVAPLYSAGRRERASCRSIDSSFGRGRGALPVVRAAHDGLSGSGIDLLLVRPTVAEGGRSVANPAG